VGQQLSTKAARTIYTRLVALFGDSLPTPEEILSADEGALRSVGLSRQKIGYLRDLARHVRSGELDFAALHDLSDEEVAARIIAVKGLGRWSADMFKSITATYAG
jgi:DNA-3-methyladenine glycosylase II